MNIIAQNKNIKLVAVDMDGTLLNEEGKISKENIEAIKSLQKQGKDFVVCTGRNFEDARRPVEEAGLICDFICMNGAMTCTYQGDIIKSYGFPKEKVSHILEVIEAQGMVIDIMTQRGSYTTTSREQFMTAMQKQILLPTHEEDFSIERFHFTTIEKFIASKLLAYKLSAIHENQSLLSHLKEKLMKIGHFNMVSSAPTNIEITCREAEKGKALLAYAKRRNLSRHELMAIGDSENDVSMLSLDLGATVAMSHGMEEAKRAARYTTDPNEKHGVASAIYEFALI